MGKRAWRDGSHGAQAVAAGRGASHWPLARRSGARPTCTDAQDPPPPPPPTTPHPSQPPDLAWLLHCVDVRRRSDAANGGGGTPSDLGDAAGRRSRDRARGATIKSNPAARASSRAATMSWPGRASRPAYLASPQSVRRPSGMARGRGPWVQATQRGVDWGPPVKAAHAGEREGRSGRLGGGHYFPSHTAISVRRPSRHGAPGLGMAWTRSRLLRVDAMRRQTPRGAATTAAPAVCSRRQGSAGWSGDGASRP